jgi:hypothetical protein
VRDKITGLLVHQDGRRRDLLTHLPDGSVVWTPWPEGRRFYEPAQVEQADKHRKAVRERLRLAQTRRTR